jgi:4-hydroxy-tetrahydrodipicolinate synthase
MASFIPELKGVIAAALTPLDQDDRPALDDLPPFLAFLARRGCHGTLLLGTTGEGPSFSPAERLSILRAGLAVRQAFPEFILLAGTGTPSLEETVMLTRQAFDLSYNGVVVLPPYYFRKASDDGLFEWFSRLIRRAVPQGGALLAYHIPGMTGVPFSLDLLSRLKDAFPARFAGLKDSSADPQTARQLGERFGGELGVFSGTDSLFSLALQQQASGCITALANLRSPDLRLVWEAHLAGEDGGGDSRAAQQRLDLGRAVMDRYPPNPPLYKALLARWHGFPRWAVRAPLLPMPAELEQRVAAEARQAVPEFAA